VLGLLLLLQALPLQARSDKPALHWVRGSGAEACIDPRNLARLVEDITGPSLVTAAQADVSIEARIEVASADAYIVRMRLVSRSAANSDERVVRFETDDCRSLDRSIALLIASAIDPALGAEGVPSELSWVDDDSSSSADNLRRELAAQPRPAPAARVASAPAAPAITAPELHLASVQGESPWRLGAAAIGGMGADARGAVGLLLDLSLTLTPNFAIAVQLSGETALSARDLQSGRSVFAQRFAIALLGCLQLPLSTAIELRGCVGPELGGVLANGSGFQMNKSALLTAGGALARLELLLTLGGGWKLSAGLMLHAELGRARVSYERAADSFEAFRVAPWQLQAILGVAYAF
jgi:hypothetical protein